MLHPKENLRNMGFYYYEVCTAQTIEKLDQLAMDIHYDIWEDMPYTKVRKDMDLLRCAWSQRFNTLRDM